MTEFFILIISSVVLIVLAVRFLLSVKKIAKQGVQVEGVVFDVEQSLTNDNNITYPSIRFQTVQNEWITKTSKLGVVPGVYKKGKKVIVIYENGNPENFFIKSKFVYLLPIGMIIIGILLTIIGILRLIHV